MAERAAEERSWTGSARARRRAGWAAALGVIAVAVALIIVFVPSWGSREETFSNEPAQTFTPKKTTPVDPEARRVAGQFILTAVARKQLDKAYDLAHPDLRGTMTRSEWRTGNIPVVFYPADAIDFASFKVERSNAGEVVLQVFLVPKQGTETEPAVFTIGLKREGTGPWLVNYWAPNFRPVLPAPNG